MGDVQRCFKCGGDRIAEVVQDGQPLCAKCAGVPTIADRFKDLLINEESAFRNRMKDLYKFNENHD